MNYEPGLRSTKKNLTGPTPLLLNMYTLAIHIGENDECLCVYVYFGPIGQTLSKGVGHCPVESVVGLPFPIVPVG